MKRLLSFALLGALAFSTLALAQDREAKVREILRITQTDQTVDQMIDFAVPEIMNQIRPLVKQAYPQVPDSVFDILREEMIISFKQSSELLIDQMVPLYVESFTDEELDMMYEFYLSPEGQSIARKSGQLMIDSMQIGQQWGRAAGDLAAQRAIQRLAEEGYPL